MRDLVVIVPTKGRPDNATALWHAFRDTCEAATLLVLVVERDELELYEGVAPQFGTDVVLESATPHPKRRGCVAPLNQVALQFLDDPEPPFALAFMGDDHRPRTKGWDRRYVEALAAMRTGIVYGNDLVQGRRLPTQVAMTSDIVAELGWMAPPELRHLYVDDFWRELGTGADCLAYLDDVIVEHLHPTAGTATEDDGYRAVNSSLMYALDRGSWFTLQRTGGLINAIAKIRGLAVGTRG